MVYLCIGLPPEDINFLNHPPAHLQKNVSFLIHFGIKKALEMRAFAWVVSFSCRKGTSMLLYLLELSCRACISICSG